MHTINAMKQPIRQQNEVSSILTTQLSSRIAIIVFCYEGRYHAGDELQLLEINLPKGGIEATLGAVI